MKKVKVGVIGAGHLGRFHAQKYAELEGALLVGVADIDKTRADEVALNTNSRAYTDYEELFSKVEAVSIVTPTDTHFKIAKAFLEKSIDVLVEKPITVTMNEADILINEAEKKGALLQVGHLERFNPAVLALKGRLKTPLFIESHRLSPFPDRALDVCVVLDLMIHDIDIILSLVKSDVETIEAVGVPVISDKVDIANARIRFKNGCVANVTASRISRERLRRIRIFQPDAYISIDYASQNISISRIAHGEKRVILQEEIEIEKKDSLKEEISSFLRCVITRTPPLVSGSDGKNALEVAHAIQSSVETSLEGLRRRVEKDANPSIL